MLQEAFESMIERSLIGEVGTVLLVLGVFMVVLGLLGALEGFFKDITGRQ